MEVFTQVNALRNLQLEVLVCIIMDPKSKQYLNIQMCEKRSKLRYTHAKLAFAYIGLQCFEKAGIFLRNANFLS